MLTAKTTRCAVAAMVLTLCIAGCKKDAADDTAAAAEVAVTTVHPAEGSISEHISADALLAPVAQAAITPRISAPIRKFYVKRGSHVKQGELLATLENRDLTAAALESRGSYTAAQAAFETATRAQVPEDYQKAQLDLDQAKANLALNQSIVKARKELFEQGAAPGRDLDTAEAALVQAQATYDAAAKHLESMKAVSREAALHAAQGQLTSAEGHYQGAEAQVSFSEIRSPIAGVVTDRPLFAGEIAGSGTALITVMDTSSLLAKTHLAQALVQRMRVGDESQVDIPGVSEPVPAKVVLISPALDPGSTTVEVWIGIDNRGGQYRVGTPVHVRIIGRTAEHALLIPQEALQVAQDGSASVMLVGADKLAHKRAVTVGIRDGAQAQILSGLSPADTVVSVGGYALEEGTRVKPGGGEDADEADPSKKPAAGRADP